MCSSDLHWFNNGNKSSEGNYKNGNLDSTWTYWYENGAKIREGNFVNGLKHGKWTVWYENGAKEHEGAFENGLENGKWTSWYPCTVPCDGDVGQKKDEGNFTMGKMSDEWTGWYRNGKLKYKTNYREDMKHGKWVRWYPCLDKIGRASGRERV